MHHSVDITVSWSQRARLACTLSGPQLCAPFGFTSSCPNASGWVLVYLAAAHMYCRQPPPKTSSAACGSRHAGTPLAAADIGRAHSLRGSQCTALMLFDAANLARP